MSCYHSDKCTEQELKDFKREVLVWLNNNFDIVGLKIRAFRCYGGDVRIYTGYNEFPNTKSSFRRTEPEKDRNGNIIGWHGERGHHTRRYAEYISINRSEFDTMKRNWKKMKGDDYEFWKEMFIKLKLKS